MRPPFRPGHAGHSHESFAIELPATFHPNRKNLAVASAVSLAMAIGGGVVLSQGNFLGMLIMAFGLICLAIFGVQMLPMANYLRLTDAGFTSCHLFRTASFKWSQISEISTTMVGTQPRVVWKLAEGVDPPPESVAITMTSYDAALPEAFNMEPKQLADMMEKLRVEHS